MPKTLEERTKDALFTAKSKLFVKLGIFLLCCITASIICATAIRTTWSWLFPALLSIIPIALGVLYGWMIRKDMMTYRIMTVTEKRKNIVGGILFKSSLSQKNYTFFYTDDDGQKSFIISRGSIFNTMTIGQTYLVLFNKNKPAGADNFIEFTTIETTGDEKEMLFDTWITQSNNKNDTRKTDKK